MKRIIEEGFAYRIVEYGGHVNYSQEFLFHLSHLPKEEADRIVAEIEYRSRIRRVVERKFTGPIPY